MELIKHKNANIWNNKVQIEMTVKELQIFADSVGKTSYTEMQERWKDRGVIPYSSEEFYQLYLNASKILEEEGGKVGV